MQYLTGKFLSADGNFSCTLGFAYYMESNATQEWYIQGEPGAESETEVRIFHADTERFLAYGSSAANSSSDAVPQDAASSLEATTQNRTGDETQLWVLELAIDAPLLEADGMYVLEQKGTGRRLEVLEEGPAGTLLATRSGLDPVNTSQYFVVRRIRGEVYTISPRASGQFLDTQATESEFFPTLVRDFQGNFSQAWLLVRDVLSHHDEFVFIHVSTGRLLGAFTELPGGKGDYWAYTAAPEERNLQGYVDAQVWRLRKLAPLPVLSDGVYRLAQGYADPQCLDANPDQGIVTSPQEDSESQLWQVRRMGGDVYRLLQLSSGEVLDVEVAISSSGNSSVAGNASANASGNTSSAIDDGGAPTVDTLLKLSPPVVGVEEPSHLWYPIMLDDGVFSLRQEVTGGYLTNNGTAIVAREGWSGDAPQLWTLHKVAAEECRERLASCPEPFECGFQDDLCGGELTCGPSSNGTCEQWNPVTGHVHRCTPDHTCECVRKTECNRPDACGTEADGCGGEVTCGLYGQCALQNSVTGEAHQCIEGACQCVPKTTCEAKLCGEQDDGCGGYLACPCPEYHVFKDRHFIYQSGPRVSSVAIGLHCSRWHGTLEEAAEKCTNDFQCSVLADFRCDGREWRYCVKSLETLKGVQGPDLSSCTKVAAKCSPRKKCDPGKVCGFQPDGCGGRLACGRMDGLCPAHGDRCYNGTCSCEPSLMNCAGRCGIVLSDGCGGEQVCGCPDREVCDIGTGMCVDEHSLPIEGCDAECQAMQRLVPWDEFSTSGARRLTPHSAGPQRLAREPAPAQASPLHFLRGRAHVHSLGSHARQMKRHRHHTETWATPLHDGLPGATADIASSQRDTPRADVGANEVVRFTMEVALANRSQDALLTGVHINNKLAKAIAQNIGIPEKYMHLRLEQADEGFARIACAVLIPWNVTPDEFNVTGLSVRTALERVVPGKVAVLFGQVLARDGHEKAIGIGNASTVFPPSLALEGPGVLDTRISGVVKMTVSNPDHFIASDNVQTALASALADAIHVPVENFRVNMSIAARNLTYLRGGSVRLVYSVVIPAAEPAEIKFTVLKALQSQDPTVLTQLLKNALHGSGGDAALLDILALSHPLMVAEGPGITTQVLSGRVRLTASNLAAEDPVGADERPPPPAEGPGGLLGLALASNSSGPQRLAMARGLADAARVPPADVALGFRILTQSLASSDVELSYRVRVPSSELPEVLTTADEALRGATPASMDAILTAALRQTATGDIGLVRVDSVSAPTLTVRGPGVRRLRTSTPVAHPAKVSPAVPVAAHALQALKRAGGLEAPISDATFKALFPADTRPLAQKMLARANASQSSAKQPTAAAFKQYAWYYYFFYYYRLMLARTSGVPEAAAEAQAAALARPSAKEQLRLVLSGKAEPGGLPYAGPAAPNGAQLLHDLLHSNGLPTADEIDYGGSEPAQEAPELSAPAAAFGLKSSDWADRSRQQWQQTLAEAQRLADSAMTGLTAVGAA